MKISRPSSKRKDLKLDDFYTAVHRLRGTESVAEPYRIEGISEGIYYKWFKDFMKMVKSA